MLSCMFQLLASGETALGTHWTGGWMGHWGLPSH